MNFNFNENGLNIELVRITEEFAATHTEEEISAITSNFLNDRSNMKLIAIPHGDKTIIKFQGGAGIYYNYEDLDSAPFLISQKEANKIIQKNGLETIEKITKLFQQRNTKQAIRLLNKASAEGVHEACFMLAVTFYHGFYCKQSYKKAFEFFNKAAKNGSQKAYCEIARMYYFGEYVETNYNKAFQNYLIAADNGHPKGQFSVGVALIEGKPGNIPIDIERGLEYLQKSSDQGLMNATQYLQFNIQGDCHASA